PTVSCPQPGGHHRFEFMLNDEQSKEEMEDPDRVRDLIGHYVDPDEVTVLRKLVYTFNAVVADQWRAGRILLAGDAAHMTPQFIGQGMNSGVRDADNLSWKLGAIIQHGADLDLLDTYETERRPHAKAMIDLSVFNKSLVSIDNRFAAGARDVALATALKVPGLNTWIREAKMKPSPRFKRGAYFGLPRNVLRGVEGTLAPQPDVRTFDGRHQRLDDALGLGFAVIGYGVDPRDGLGVAQRNALQILGTQFVTVYPTGGRPQGEPGDARVAATDYADVEDHTGELARWFAKAGVAQGGTVLLRPDKYVFGTSAKSDATELVTALLARLAVTPAMLTADHNPLRVVASATPNTLEEAR
ncbi:FAD-dependent monooxygenase, partial [Amycolatopsis sp. NPDC003676]